MPHLPVNADARGRCRGLLGGVVFTMLAATGGAHAAVPPVPVPPENPITADKAVLGKILFWDEQLSSDNTQACGSCHMPEDGGADARFAVAPGADGIAPSADDIFGSLGVIRRDATLTAVVDPFYGLDPQVTGRAAPNFFGALWSRQQFWDGRAGPDFVDPETGALSIRNNGSLEAQAIGPILSDVEMAHEGRSWDDVTSKLAIAQPLELASDIPFDVQSALDTFSSYPELFQAAFGTADITGERIGMAIATYERTLVADETPWDAFDEGDPTALTPRQVAGMRAFQGSTCDTCHRPPLFTDNSFRNIGLRPPAEDLGRQDVTGNAGDRGRFKVPSLRNVGLKDQFMHNGRLGSLQQVLDFYTRRGGQVQFADNLDRLVRGINLNPGQVADIVDFLENGLTDPRVEAGEFPFDRPSLHATVDACNDGIDNDGDGVIDSADPGCESTGDTTETSVLLRCDDGIDNDRDGLTDLLDLDCDGGPDPVVPDPIDPDPTLIADLVLDANGPRIGRPLTLTVSGARPGVPVLFMVSLNDGLGSCLPAYGLCSGLINPITVGSELPDANGDASLTIVVPNTVTPDVDAFFQAVWLDADAFEGQVSEVLRRRIRR